MSEVFLPPVVATRGLMELREIETTITYECRKIRILKIKSYKKKTTPNINAITKVFKLNKLHKTSKTRN